MNDAPYPLPGNPSVPPGCSVRELSGRDSLPDDYAETFAARRAEEERWREEDRRYFAWLDRISKE